VAPHSPAAVLEAHAHLQALLAAWQPEAPPMEAPREMRGSLLFYLRGPGGILVEVGHRPDA
jgi:hypothetical protein